MYKLIKVGIIATLVIGFTLPSVSSAHAATVSNNPSIQTTHSVLDTLKPYIKKSSKGTLYLDNAYKNDPMISKDAASYLKNYYSLLNGQIKAGKLTVNNDLTITEKSTTNSTSPLFTTLASSSGKNSFQWYWWGFRWWLNDRAATQFSQQLIGTGSLSVAISTISRYIPVPPTQLASVIGGLIGGGIVGFGKTIDSKNKGRGVEIEASYAPPHVTVFSQ